jgi:hypothetical protein
MNVLSDFIKQIETYPEQDKTTKESKLSEFISENKDSKYNISLIESMLTTQGLTMYIPEVKTPEATPAPRAKKAATTRNPTAKKTAKTGKTATRKTSATKTPSKKTAKKE